MTVYLRFFLTLLTFAALPLTAAAQDITGLWRTEATERGYLEIDVQPCGAALCGTIARGRNLAGETGPYEHTGRQIFWDMTATGAAGSWDGGKIWDPRNGRTYNSRMSVNGGQLSVSGCVLGLCQSQTWLRVR